MPPPGNRFLERLPRVDRLRLLALCEPVHLVMSRVICEVGEPMRHVLFPVDGFVSLVMPVDGHGGIEVGMVGREGVLGLQLALGVSAAPMRAVVQGDGLSWQLGRAALLQELAHSQALRNALHLYIHVVMVQLATASACRRFHGVLPRLARWLLMSHDRAHADRFNVTHEFMSLMLGVRRVSVTVAAGALQAAGSIRYHRGEVWVLDRAALEAQACSCYAADRAVYRRYLGEA